MMKESMLISKNIKIISKLNHLSIHVNLLLTKQEELMTHYGYSTYPICHYLSISLFVLLENKKLFFLSFHSLSPTRFSGIWYTERL